MSKLLNQIVQRGISGSVGIQKTASAKADPKELEAFADELRLISKKAEEEEKKDDIVETEEEEVEETENEVEEGEDIAEDTKDSEEQAEEVVEEAIQEAVETEAGEEVAEEEAVVEEEGVPEEELTEEEAMAILEAAIESGEITPEEVAGMVDQREVLKEAAMAFILEKLAEEAEEVEDAPEGDETVEVAPEEVEKAVVECLENGEITPEEAEKILEIVEEEKIASAYPNFYAAAMILKQAAEEEQAYNDIKGAVTESILEEIAAEGAEGEMQEGGEPAVDENFVSAVEAVSKEVVGELMHKLNIDPAQYAGALVEDPDVAAQVAEGAEKIASENGLSVYAVINDIIESL